MTFLARRMRSLLIGLVVLALSAGVALASAPSTPSSADQGLANAGSASGRTVPVADPVADSSKDANDKDEKAEQDKDEASESDNCKTDPTKLTVKQLAELTHGQIVCWAAHQDTPAGYDNHGAWVSSFAKDNSGTANKPASAGQRP
jgi:hypothetical protein